MAHDTFEADLMKVGQERDFYRIREMTESDVAWVKASLVDPMRPPELRHAAGQWLAVFATIGGLRRKLEMIGADTSHMEAIYIEAEEQLHTEIENRSAPLLNRLLESDRFCLHDVEDYSAFMHFMMTQYFRTSRMLRNTMRGSGERFHETFERSMGAMRHILATASASTLISTRDTMIPYLVVNETAVPLITGDQPVINMLAVDLPPDEMVQDCEFYYPLAPNKALIVTRSARYSSGKIVDADEAREFNRLIAVAAERQIYAAQEPDFIDVRGLVGAHLA